MSSRRERTAVVGVGNILMGDEGIGVRSVQALRREDLPAEVELFDGGTAFHALLGELERFERLIIVDAVKGGKPPGTVHRFSLGEVEGARGTVFSLHDVGVTEALTLERLIHHVPQEVVFIGIEPQRIAPSMELSPALERQLPTLIQRVLQEIQAPAVCE